MKFNSLALHVLPCSETRYLQETILSNTERVLPLRGNIRAQTGTQGRVSCDGNPFSKARKRSNSKYREGVNATTHKCVFMYEIHTIS